MKKIFITILFMVCLLLGCVLTAYKYIPIWMESKEITSQNKFAYIDIEQIWIESRECQDKKKQLESLWNNYQADANKLQICVQNRLTNVSNVQSDTNNESLNEDSKINLQNKQQTKTESKNDDTNKLTKQNEAIDLKTLSTEKFKADDYYLLLFNNVTKKRRQLDVLEINLKKAFYEKISKIITTFTHDNKYTCVFNTIGIACSGTLVNITNEITRILDSEGLEFKIPQFSSTHFGYSKKDLLKIIG